ncbi:helix-turn-helix domain-containing protein [Streptomyces sp. PR69]|uniref:helix-turn-helix domain-containing protein n=1 Tax=Streptomyces sp. PR69 TaxID=2984950 RepID=UPI002263DC3A|nr:helix-turn-helix domain-containing protein [Streptomyces sp. PR69]
MSDNSYDATRTLRAVPDPEPLTGLTGAPAAIYTELAGRTEPATAAELALAAALGRSTASKALVTLEEHGLALRTPGGHDGALRTPDHWRAAPTPDTTQETDEHTEPDTSATSDSPKPLVDNADESDDTPDAKTAPDAPSEPSDVTASISDAPRETPPQDSQPGQVNDDGSDAGGVTTSPAEADDTTRHLEVVTVPGGKHRLAPGALRQMVIDHLKTHPGEAFTATRISRVIEKSSGAIANALVKLTQQGITEKVSDYPRTYRWAEGTTE